MQKETRKIPNKFKIIMVVLTLLAIITFIIITSLKEAKITEILQSLGHTNVSNVKVINKLNVEDKDTKKRSSVYKVAFFDKDKNKECVGFLHKNPNNKYTEDLDCK